MCLSVFQSSPEDMLTDFRERGREGERRETSISSSTGLTQDQTLNLYLQDHAPAKELHQPGLLCPFLRSEEPCQKLWLLRPSPHICV